MLLPRDFGCDGGKSGLAGKDDRNSILAREL
jgi:hypothetical protein